MMTNDCQRVPLATPGHVPVVASWNADAETSHRVDFRLVQNTFVTMFWERSILAEVIGWLGDHRYDVVSFDAASWTSTDVMFDDVARGLDFPDYFGRNLAALTDCMRDVASSRYGWSPNSTGLVIVLRAFDSFARFDRRTAQIMLDIVAA